MDNRKINQDVYERYVDATVALFMEYYSAERAEDMHNELAGNEKIEVELPIELDNRCRTLIKKEHARRKRKQHMKSAMKGLRFVASFAVIILALASVLFVSVEAIRVPIINYYISLGGEYLEIAASSPTASDQTDEINWEDPLGGLIPDGYTPSIQQQTTLGKVVTVYSNQNNDSIFFTTDSLNAVKRIDTENAQKAYEIRCGGQNAVLIEKGGVITVVWGQESLGKSCMIRSAALTESEIIAIAEAFIQKVG